MKILKCENCGANIEIKEGKQEGYCEYCGAKYVLNSEKHEEDYELERLIVEETERTKREKFKIAEERKKIIMAVVGTIMFVIMCIIIGFSADACEKRNLEKKEQEHIVKGEIKTTISASACEGKDYEDVVLIFETAGFENIVLAENPDLILGFLAQEYEVDTVTINGDGDFDKGDWFSKNAIVKITYHVFP